MLHSRFLYIDNTDLVVFNEPKYISKIVARAQLLLDT